MTDTRDLQPFQECHVVDESDHETDNIQNDDCYGEGVHVHRVFLDTSVRDEGSFPEQNTPFFY